jgi:ribonuclease G
MERQLQRAVYVRADEKAHIEAYTIMPGDMNDLEKSRGTVRRAQVVECRIMRSQVKEPNKCVGWADGYLLDLDDGTRFVGQKAKVRVTDVRRSYGVGQLVPGSNRPVEAE